MAIRAKKLAEFSERLHGGYWQGFELVGEPIVDEQSDFQHIQIFDTPDNGRVLVLDGIVQLTSRDEDSYSEMLAHPPITEHGGIRTVLIVGGGDGAVAEEVLKHDAITRVVLAEIDPRVIELSKAHLSDISSAAFADARLDVRVMDAAEHLKSPEARGAYDLIIGDRPDPVGPAQVLFADDFYTSVRDALTDDGVAVFQTGAPFFQAQELSETDLQLGRIFPSNGLYLTVTPTYTGGFMALTWASRGLELGNPDNLSKIDRRWRKAKIATTYYTPNIHRAAYALPRWIEQLVGSENPLRR
jgi:spermidine synthase